MEQEGGAGHGTSHQTFKGDTSVTMAHMCLGSVEGKDVKLDLKMLYNPTCYEKEDYTNPDIQNGSNCKESENILNVLLSSVRKQPIHPLV